MAKEGLIARQFMLGVVQTADGLPIYHEVFDGNQAEAPTLIATVQKVLARYAHIRRLMMVADRGLLSLDNLDELGTIQLPSGQPLEFILAVPGRRYGEFFQTLSAYSKWTTTGRQSRPWQCGSCLMTCAIASGPITASSCKTSCVNSELRINRLTTLSKTSSD